MDLPSPLPSLTTLLPLLFSPTPSSLPASLLSTPTLNAHTYLHPTPSSPGYLTPYAPSEELEVLRRRVVEGREWEGEGGGGGGGVGEVGWCVEEGEVRVRIPIGREGLAVVLLWEEEEAAHMGGGAPQEEEGEGTATRPAWTFLTLALCPPASTPTNPFYHPSLARALAPKAIDIAPTKSKSKTAEEMAEGEGTTPGAYGAAEDFWAGWSDDEREPADEHADAHSVDGDSDRAGAHEARKEEGSDSHDGQHHGDGDAYWARYGSVESLVGDDSHPHPAPHPHPPPPLPTADPAPRTRSRRSSTIRPPSSAIEVGQGTGTTTPVGTAAYFAASTPGAGAGVGAGGVRPPRVSLLSSTSPTASASASASSPSSSQSSQGTTNDSTPASTTTTTSTSSGDTKSSLSEEEESDAAVLLVLRGAWTLYRRSKVRAQVRTGEMEVDEDVIMDGWQRLTDEAAR